MTQESQALADLQALTSHGPRFHGTDGIAAASWWIEEQLSALGLATRREPVALPG